MREELTFEDGILICKHIYQSAIEKVLNGVIEQDQIFYKTHKMLSELNCNVDKERLDELLYLLNVENTYAVI